MRSSTSRTSPSPACGPGCANGSPTPASSAPGRRLRSTLKPLGALVREVHSSMTSVPVPPTEITVTFGIQLTQDLQLGIVTGNNQAHLTVTAGWSPPAAG
ncbi:CU044_2847 family protein [Streptomyces sp. NPDC006656]|uniref:CU044_2847 family protein n=1 Tax=unclassified Streptomyces TaxID=2593676 RepID=UPI003406D832